MSFLNGYILLFSPAGSRVISVIMCVVPWITLLAWFEHQATPFLQIYGGQNGISTGFSPSTSVFTLSVSS
jgi:hypothetical protein